MYFCCFEIKFMRYSLHMYHAYFLMMFLVHKLGFKRLGSVFQWVFNVREWFHEVSNSVTWVFLIFMFGTTLLIFCTKCEGKFVPVAPTSKILLSMCSVLAWAGGRADSWQLCQPIRVMCQPMTGCSWDHATSWTTESDIFKKVWFDMYAFNLYFTDYDNTFTSDA